MKKRSGINPFGLGHNNMDGQRQDLAIKKSTDGIKMPNFEKGLSNVTASGCKPKSGDETQD